MAPLPAGALRRLPQLRNNVMHNRQATRMTNAGPTLAMKRNCTSACLKVAKVLHEVGLSDLQRFTAW